MAERKTPSLEEKFEKKIKQLEDRIESIGKRVEAKGEDLGKRIEEKAEEISKKADFPKYHGHSLFWGIVLVALGILWLGNNLRWFYFDVPWLAVITIAGGIYLIIRHWERVHEPSQGSGEKD